MIDITLYMKPIAKARARFSSTGCYTPERTKAAEQQIAWQVRAYMKAYDIAVYEGPVWINLVFCFEKPAKTKDIYPSKRPDIDNLVKLVCDSLNRIAYKDDKQIVSIEAHKIYGERDYIGITLDKY